MEQHNLDELIDAFLKKEIKAADRALLMKMMDSDPEIAALVKESEETYQFLQYMRYEKIREQLQAFDHEVIQKRNRFPFKKWMIIAIVFFIATVYGWFWMVSYFKTENIAGRNFEAMAIQDPAGDLINLDLANKYFINGDFENAARLIQPYTGHRQGSRYYQAKWNVLMCHLAMKGFDQRWNEEMKKFLSEPSNPFLRKGNKVLALLNSTFYRFFTTGSSNPLSTIKPRLI